MGYENYRKDYTFIRRSNYSKILRDRRLRKRKILCDVNTLDIADTAHEYSQNSSLHGLRYVGNKDLHIVERLFWIISFVLATSISGYFIIDLLEKWFDKPVIMSLSPKSTSLTAIPFPAVTVCNMNNVRKSVAERIIKSNQSIQDQILLKDFCEEDTILGSTIDDNTTSSWLTVQKFMVKVSQPCHEMILSCFWHGEQQNCADIFNPVLTDEGMCCAFNRVKNELVFRNPLSSDLNLTFPFTSIDWTPEKGYADNTPLNHVPWRPWGAGSHLGLTIVVNAELNEYYCSSEASHGFKISLHNPVETPKISSFGTLLCPGTETQVIIKPTIDIAGTQLKQIDPEKRQCFFSDERTLRFYRTYTQRNCIMECESNFTLHYCQCVMYYMPKDTMIRICGKRDIPCANRAKPMETKLMDWWSSNDTNWQNTSYKPTCGCLPACYSILYSKIETSSHISTYYKIKKEYTMGRDIDYFRKNMAVVHFFFTEAQFTGIIKGELFGTTELLSATGGLLGLFMGFSFLSVIEAVYFVTLRLWCSIRMKRNARVRPLNVTQKRVDSVFLYPFVK